MHIHEIIIDGFKSYATRTVISGFDCQFNAITGLNGSGKSNILDAICFVLGISNLTQVRAHSLQELVYKQGQAGVTKASVTIIFNNEDRTQSPIGYEDHSQIIVTRQVAIGGRNKYMINGTLAQQNRVQNLFQSVQLNINNPTFLIMQGRITKVINMKPLELLSMIEETAGTRMYQTKKEAALKTMEKKEQKVAEINRVLSEEITPSLEKLRKERSQFMKWSALNTEGEQLSRLVTAYGYFRSREVVDKAELEGNTMLEGLQELTRKSGELQITVNTKKDLLARLKEEKEQEESKEMKTLKARVVELSKQLVKMSRTLENKRDTQQATVATRDKLVSTIAELTEAVAKKTEELVAAKKAAVQALKDEKTAKEQSEAMQQIILSGVAMDSSVSEKSLADKLMDAKRKITQAETEIQAANVRKAHFEAELKTKSTALKTASKEIEKQDALRKSLSDEVAAAKRQLEKIGFNADEKEKLAREIKEGTDSLRALQERIDLLANSLNDFDFQYADPEPGFDRTKVKGLVAQLIQVSNLDTATALEVTAGAKLYQVVVDTDRTGKALLSAGKLKKRVTIIPLNKIESSTIPKSTLDAAAKVVGKDKARLALSLVGYDDEVDAAMKYVFGRTIICSDDDSAKTVAFDKNVRCRAVTYAGDIFDPQGTVTGGSRPSATSSTLLRLQQLSEAREEYTNRTVELEKKQERLNKINALAQNHVAASRELSLKSHELQLLEDRLKQTAQHKLLEEVNSLEQGIGECTKTIQTAIDAKQRCEVEAVQLQKEIGGDGRSKEKQEKDNQKKLVAAKERALTASKNAKLAQAQVEATESELKTTQEELVSSKEQLVQSNLAVNQGKVELEEVTNATAQVDAEHETAKEEAAERQRIINETNKEISRVAEEISGVESRLTEVKNDIKRLEHKIGNHKKDVKESEKACESYLKKYTWIESEKHLFGRPKTDYDFAAKDPAKAQERLAALQDEQTKLGKKINKKVMSLFDKAEAEFQELVRKKRIIEADKEKIERVIEELDEKKNQALKTTWAKVNRDFGSIFSTLLPGAKAKLEPQEGMSVLEGLEFKVGFGDCWKDSLSELSGGQRSLLALSLILSLLLFKPAPMYILDEIDAALDLSHTQNIGIMLRTHFTKSQFIIVSLKEGMFNNANVLFRTKFVDGVSTVARTTPGIRSR